MIIWSRWGILVFVCLGLGVGTGALLHLLVSPGVTEGAGFGVFMGVGLMFAGVYTWLLDRYVVSRHLDKPRQQFFLEPLPQPVVHPNGMKQTHRQIPVLHPETGQPVLVRPRSSLFFVPVGIWAYVLGSIGILVTIGCAIALLAA